MRRWTARTRSSSSCWARPSTRGSVARDEANWEPLGVLLRELAQWFPHHVAMMDAGLAMHLEAVGFPF